MSKNLRRIEKEYHLSEGELDRFFEEEDLLLNEVVIRILRGLDEIVRLNYGDENNLWVTEEESEDTDELPGLLNGVYDDCFEFILKVLKEDK